MKKMIVLLLSCAFLFGLDVKKIYYSSYNYEKMGDYKDAIKVLIPLYQKYPNGYTLNLRLGWLFYLNKNYSNAIKHYLKASMVLPRAFEPRLGLMRVYLALQNYNSVLKTGEIILKNDYYNYYANYYDVIALVALKEYKTALALCNKMLSIYPSDVLFLSKLGEVYYLKGNKDLAKKIFNDVLILDPNNVTAKKYLNENSGF